MSLKNLEKLYNNYVKDVNIGSERAYHILIGLNNIPDEELTNDLRTQWDNMRLLNFLQEIFDDIVAYSKKTSPEEVIHYYLKLVKILGRGVQGVVSQASLLDQKGILTIKNSSRETVLHEFLVSQTLKDISPVFSNNFAVVPCSPLLSVDNEAISFCQTDSALTLISQFVPGFNVSILTRDEFVKCILILLDVFYKSAPLQFNHNDLHDQNVLIRKFESPVLVNINLPNLLPFRIKTSAYPTIIDYGFARIVGKNKLMGPINAKYGLIDSYRPLFDIYKFIHFAVYHNPKLYVETLFAFFGPGSSEEGYFSQLKLENQYFVLPKRFYNSTIGDYVKSLKDLIPFFETKDTNLHVVGQYPPEDFYQRYGLSLPKTPDNSFEQKVAVQLKKAIGKAPIWADETMEFVEELENLFEGLKERFEKTRMNKNDFLTKYYRYSGEFLKLKNQFKRLSKQDKGYFPTKTSEALLSIVADMLAEWKIIFESLARTDSRLPSSDSISPPKV